MKFYYQFIGGSLNDVTFTNPIDAWAFSDGNSGDLSGIRKRGGLVRRAELDNQPTFNGYLGPMWDGKRVKGTDGNWHYTFDTFTPADPEETVCILRYESQEVYDIMSH